jgi:hypothetical protein
MKFRVKKLGVRKGRRRSMEHIHAQNALSFPHVGA